MIRPALAAAACAALFAAAPALAQSPANPSPAAVRAGVYAVEPSHTRIVFSVSHMGFTTWYGNFTDASGQLTVAPGRPTADTVEVRVPTASVSTTNAKLDGELKAADWLDAAKYPTIRFVSRKVVSTGPGRADVTGDFTLHGVTKPLVLHVKFNGAGVNPLNHAYTAGFEGQGRIRRSDFGVTKYVPLIGDDVDITISAAFEQAAK